MFVNITKNRIYIYALILFVLSAIYGLLIRWNFIFPIESFTYRNFLQSHSHVAFLGWGYVAVIGVIIQLFIPKEKLKVKTYNNLLLIILVTIALMLVSFPLVGYKLFSIVLLCLFGVTSYVLSYFLLKDINGNSPAIKLVRFGIYYYLLSSLATWFLAWVLVTQGKTNLYYNTVYFYLHFLYNGFFVFALFGLLFKLLENEGIMISAKLQYRFFFFLNIACIPAFALSILWSQKSMMYNTIGFVASILQLISLFFLLKITFNVYMNSKWKRIFKHLFVFGLLAYSLKIVMQVFSAIPFFVEKSLALKPFFIIGYLHLFTLAFMSVFIFLFLFKWKKLNLSTKSARIGIYSFLVGVLLTEFLLFFQGFRFLFKSTAIKNYNVWLFCCSLIIVIGLIFILTNQFRKQKID